MELKGSIKRMWPIVACLMLILPTTGNATWSTFSQCLAFGTTICASGTGCSSFPGDQVITHGPTATEYHYWVGKSCPGIVLPQCWSCGDLFALPSTPILQN